MLLTCEQRRTQPRDAHVFPTLQLALLGTYRSSAKRLETGHRNELTDLASSRSCCRADSLDVHLSVRLHACPSLRHRRQKQCILLRWPSHLGLRTG